MTAHLAQTADSCLRSRSSTALLSSARHVDGRDPLRAKAASGANIHAAVIGEAQSCRSIESKGIVRALEVYSGPAELLGDDNIIQRITTDREIDAVAAVVDPNEIVAVTLGKIDRGIITRYIDVIVTGAARHGRRSADPDHIVARAGIDRGVAG